MKIRAEIAAVVILIPLFATAQDAARDIARQMGADTTTSISPGLDRHDIHRDTESVERPQQHVPKLLEAPQAEASKSKKLSTSERKKLLRRRELLVESRDAAIATASKQAKEASQKPDRVYVTGQQVTENKAAAKAEREWDARSGKELQAIDRKLKQRSEDGASSSFHAPSLINPK
jgi:hypothetical protein